jgi:DNA invertase Pin-like site-specific DNA recombinase
MLDKIEIQNPQYGGLPFIAYTRVSKKNTDGRGCSIEEQLEWIAKDSVAKKFSYILLNEGDGKSGRTIDKRPKLLKALELLSTGNYQGLVVKRLDRLIRNADESFKIYMLARKEGWTIRYGESHIDTETAYGKYIATSLSSIAELESDLSSERTRAALKYKKDHGVKLGRPSKLEPEILSKVLALHSEGQTLTEITKHLNTFGFITPSGRGVWRVSSVSYLIKKHFPKDESSS